MNRLFLVATFWAFISGGAIAVTGQAWAVPPASCGANLGSQQVVDAVRSLPPDATTGRGWDTNPRTFEGNYSPCATLSTVLVTIEGATGSSPVSALMFHDGSYLGTATSKAYGFTSFNATRTTNDTVVLNYKVPGACNACAPAAVTSVRYQWQGDHVAMLDPAPPA